MHYLENELIEKDATVFRALQEASSDGTWYRDLESPENEWMDGRFWERLGYATAEMSPKADAWKKVVFEEDVEKLMDNVRKHLEDPDHPYDLEVRYTHKDGSTVWVRRRGIVIKNAEGKPIRMLGSFNDITNSKLTEQELSVKSERLNNIVEGANIGTWEWDVANNEVVFNERWAEIIGYSLDELQPTGFHTWERFVHPEDLAKSNKMLKEHFEGKREFYVLEVRMKHKLGHWIWVSARGKIVSRAENGDPLQIAGSHQDITKRKYLEGKLVEFQDLLQRTNEVARIGTWRVNLENQGLEWSQVTREIHEVDEDYLPTVSETINFYKAGKSRDEISLLFDRAIREGQPFDVELELVSAKGNERWVRSIGIPIEKNGRYVEVSGIIQNITEVKLKEAALRASEERFRKSFEFASIGKAIVGLQGQFLKVNHRLCEILGYDQEELTNLTFQEITHPEDLDKDLRLLQEVIEGKRESYTMDKRYFRKDEHIVWVTLAVSMVRDELELPKHFIDEITDITDRKMAEIENEQLLQLSKSQNSRLLNFAHIVSHNLRSHSANFVMLLDLIDGEPDTNAKLEMTSMLRGASNNLAETISHLNEVVVTSNTVYQNMRSVNLKEAVDDTVNSVEGLYHHKNGKISVNVDEAIAVEAVPAYLDSALLNLLSNAIKYSAEDRRPLVEIRAGVEDGRVWIEVEDNGQGIDLELHGAKMFGMYKTFHRHPDAKGIGLFIVKNQVEAMNGTIEVESTVNKGSTFKISLNEAI